MSSKMIDKSIHSQDLSKRKMLFSKSTWKKTLSSGYRCIAAERLVKGTQSKSFSIDKFTSAENLEPDNIHIVINEKGNMVMNQSNGEHWYKHINLAPDVHSTNIHLNITTIKKESNFSHEKFHLEITKPVEKGNELLLWFSEDVLAMINMPFLTPRNITGHKKYHCHVCEETFEYPNPLKIHILLNCGRDLAVALWQNIEIAVNKKSTSMQELNLNLQNIQNLKSPSPLASQNIVPPSSAFSPYKKQASKSPELIRKDYGIPIPPPNILPMQPLNLTVPPLDIQSLDHTHQRWMNNVLDLKISRSLEELSGNYAADVELFASNWGKLKQGHLCVYCGKVYSRKYGLKIHIRTHTGYKPLKCKYCLRPFGDPSNLNKHVRLHANGLTQYMCSLCGKVLVRRRDLERHLKSQHGSEDVSSLNELRDANSD